MEEGDLQCVERPPERPAQVHHDHHAEDRAVAEHADGVDARKKDIKTASFLPPSQMCGRCQNAMTARRKRKRTTRRRPWRV